MIDAIIGLSVVYKAFDMDGFRRFFGFEPNTKAAVLIFGLFHGFGLATKLQEVDLSKNGLITNIISFNVGVEIGQVLALTAVLPAEYGIDPLKTGALLRLTDLAKTSEAKPAVGARPAAAPAGIHTAQSESYKVDSEDLFPVAGRTSGDGSFIAPTTGIHGWFWENKGKQQVDIHLTTAGFYDGAKMYAGDKPDELTIEDVK